MSVTRANAEAFFDAMMTRDPPQIGAYVADETPCVVSRLPPARSPLRARRAGVQTRHSL